MFDAVQCRAVPGMLSGNGETMHVYRHVHGDGHVARWLSRHGDVPDKRPRLTTRLLASHGMARRRARWPVIGPTPHSLSIPCVHPQVAWRSLAEARTGLLRPGPCLLRPFLPVWRAGSWRAESVCSKRRPRVSESDSGNKYVYT